MNTSSLWPPTSGEDLLWLLILCMIGLGVIVTLAVSVYLLVIVDRLLHPASAGPRPSLWQRFVGLKPLSQEHELAMDHAYDGIVELNNPTPPWFMALFYGTIGFGVVYLGIYHVAGKGDVMVQEYTQEVAIAEQQREAYIKLVAAKINESSVTALTDAKGLEAGKALYGSYCTACHGAKGEGTVGPNLTDDYWLHGGTINAVFHTINEGVPEKGMMSWKRQLNPLQVQQVASYILSLKGTNPPNGKAPQGEKRTNDVASR